MKAWENVGQSRADALASAILAAAFPPLSDGVHAESKPAAAADNIRTNGFNFRSEEHTSELQSLMRISYAVFCLKKKTHKTQKITLYIYDKKENKNNTTLV